MLKPLIAKADDVDNAKQVPTLNDQTIVRTGTFVAFIIKENINKTYTMISTSRPACTGTQCTQYTYNIHWLLCTDFVFFFHLSSNLNAISRFLN